MDLAVGVERGAGGVNAQLPHNKHKVRTFRTLTFCAAAQDVEIEQAED